MKNSSQAALARSGDQILKFRDGERVTHDDLAGEKQIAIVIHGFTADASYMRQMMHDIASDSVDVFAFEYACHRGIDAAAENFRYRLSLLDRDGRISSRRVTLVGHSMGGLVARFLVSLLGGDQYVHTVVTLGSPHQGTLGDSEILPLLIDWSHSVASAAPLAFTPNSRSALQLIGHDPAPRLLDRLRNAPPPAQAVSFYSFSGGYSKIEFGKGFLRNAIARRWLKSNLQIPNDGLVEELSSDITSEATKACFGHARHFNEYPEYSELNHTYIASNQGVALEIANIISRNGQFVAPSASETTLVSPQPSPRDAH